MNIPIFIIVITLLGTTAANQNVTTLELDKNIQVSLNPETIYAYETNLPSDIPVNQDFFLVVQWPISDPLQYPFIQITTGDGIYTTCYKSDNQFSGVCKIPSDKLRPNATISSEVYCFVQCKLTITPLLQKQLRIGFSETHTFAAPATSGLPLEIEIQIPYELNFTQIAFYAQINSMEKAQEGLEMFANIGDENIPVPNKRQYDEYGETIYWGGKGIFLSIQDIKPGQFIKFYIYISEGMSIKFYSSYLNGNNFMLELGKTYYDYTTYKQNKIYLLDLRKMTNLTDQTISIGFLVYSGDPYVSIALESSFLHPIQQFGSISTQTYLITESVRRQYNYSGVIFVKVESIWSSNFLIFSKLEQKNFISLFPDITLFNQLEPSDVQNYFFDDLVSPESTGNSTLRSYSIKINMLKGHVTLGVRRCKSAELGSSVLNCVINSSQAITNSTIKASFQQIDITMKNSDYYYYMSFQYDAQKCAQLNISANNTKYYCSFHIAALETLNKTSDYTISLNKRLYTNTLLEGTLSRDYIYEDEYLYFRFIVGSLEDIVSVTFFYTLIEGDVYLMVSKKDQFPTMDTKSEDLYFSVGNSITLTKQQLASTMYLSVYGIQLSEFTLGVKVSRKKASNITDNTTTTTNETSNTKISLRLDLSQQFTLQQKDTSAVFLMSTPSTMNVTAEIMQLAGTVSLQIKDGSKTINCSDSKVSNNKISCTFESKEKTTYSGMVTGKKGETQKFMIIYHKADTCLPYTLNLPVFLDFESGQKACTTYSLTKLVDLQITTTVPLQNLLDHSLHMVICLNDNCLQPTLSHHTKISKNQLISHCNLVKKNNSNVFQSCPIKLNFASNTSISFEVIVEEDGKDIGLFDGIVEKITTFDITRKNGKYFYYEIYQQSAVKIFFTAFTSYAFYIALHFVEEGDFLNNTTNIYLPYRETNYDYRQDFQQNFFETVVYGSNTKIFTISSSIIKKYCVECFLTIAVYMQYEQEHLLSSFQIQVTQSETILYMGSSKLGYLQTDEIYNYQLQDNQDSDALLSITDLSRQSNKQQNCFTGSLTSDISDAPQQIDDSLAYIKKGSIGNNLYVEATRDLCNYQVSYTRVDFPLIIAGLNRKYQVKANSTGKLFFLYTHNSPESFKITQIINTGSLSLFASPVGNLSVSQLIKSSPEKFAFMGNDNDGTFQVSNKSSNFCSNCQYLIVGLARSDVNAEIIITLLNSSIPLSVNGIIKEKIIASELSFRNYTFNSITAFNISISPIYGTLKVIVMDPSKNVIASKNISTATVISIPHNKATESFSIDYESYFTEYDINIAGQVDSRYTIRASKESLTSRLFEGIPLYYTFKANQTIVLEFLNLKTANAASNTLNILVDLIGAKTNNTSVLTVNASFQGKEGEAPVDLPINNLVKADSAYNIEIPLKTGTYYIKITLDTAVQTSIILAKQSFVHLAPSTSVIMFKEGIFELYSKNKGAMIEVFACWGDITVDASSYYKDFSTSGQQYGQIIVEQNNYGGHFVINAQNIYGEYFINVRNKQKHQAQMAYIITYYYYDVKDTLPYKFIKLFDREIVYTLNKTAVTFTFNPITINWDDSDSIDSVYIEYIIYVADNKNKVNKYANCRIGNVYYDYAHQNGDSIEASVDITKINEIIGDLDIYFVGAEAIVYIDPSELADEEYPFELNLIYETIELSNVRIPISQQQSSTSYSVQMIVLWFLMPFAIAGIILYFALKYCIKKYRGLLPNQLIEEGQGESQQGVNLPNKSPYGDNPNNASQQLREQV